jgi:hypothetical protein
MTGRCSAPQRVVKYPTDLPSMTPPVSAVRIVRMG